MAEGNAFAATTAVRAVREFLCIDVDALAAFGASPPRALLLSGPPGVGKTAAMRIAAEEVGIAVNVVGPGAAAHLRLTYAFRRPDACSMTAQPSCHVVFVDELDAVCPVRSKSQGGGQHARAVAMLLAAMDGPRAEAARGLASQHRVFVVAATNRPNAVDPALRRPGRFDHELHIRPPDLNERYEILKAFAPHSDEQAILHTAERATGFVAADLELLCREARRFAGCGALATRVSSSEYMDAEVSESAHPQWKHFQLAFRTVAPSVLRDSLATDVPLASWSGIGGVVDVKKRLRMAVEWPLAHPETFKRLGLSAPRGILLHGPPGCSKTSLIRAAASESRAAFLRLSGADIYSCFLGEAERIVRRAFEAARAVSPCILFFDELDAVVGKRPTGGGVGAATDGNGVQERVLSSLLTEMDGIVSTLDVIVVGATNRVDLLDEALLRPGRFDDVLYVGLPDELSRLQILQIHARKLPISPNLDLASLARKTCGSSGADLAALCTEAGLAALRERFLNKTCCAQNENFLISSTHFAL